MPSPFPGMDPYVEADFGGVQVMMVAFMAEQLNGTLPPGLVARPERQVWLEDASGDRISTFVPDASVIEWSPDLLDQDSAGGTTGGTAVADLVATKPIRVRPFSVERSRTWLEIRDNRSGGALITAVEVLSPSNKRPGDDRRAYLRKVRDYRRARVNFVEIDLLRTPRKRFWFRWEQLPKRQRKNYLVAVWRSATREIEAYPTSVRNPLPVILVPLRPSDADAKLDVQASFSRAYNAGGFEATNYDASLDPPLSEADAKWAAELLSKSLPN